MASLDLWVDGSWGEESIAWHIEGIPFDLDRFHNDQRYAELMDKHVKRRLKHLGDELAEIAILTPEQVDEWTYCE